MKIPPKTMARIQFLEPEAGGTEHLPAAHLSANVRLNGDDETWTMLLEFLGEPAYGRTVPAIVDFLADEAPDEQLVTGLQFEILEVGEAVATGEVIVDSVEVESRPGEPEVRDGDRLGRIRYEVEERP